MSGIAGYEKAAAQDKVSKMLETMRHRGPQGEKIITASNVTLGMNWTTSQASSAQKYLHETSVRDQSGPGQFAAAAVVSGALSLSRDMLGIRPLYYGWDETNTLCFASEVKALIPCTRTPHLLAPGYQLVDGHPKLQSHWPAVTVLQDSAGSIAAHLREKLELAVSRRITHEVMGAWLSGGLDSSVLAALARPQLKKLHTFSAGLPGSPDLLFAQQVADHVHTDHHPRTLSLEELLKSLPLVIYHLESFDALLVRSSVSNFLTAQIASDYVEEIFSGEGADELFAGYDYLKKIPISHLSQELNDITQRLHNTALQRVDRCASAHATIAHIPFLDADVFAYALQIPPELKMVNHVEKWILRQAVMDLLPHAVTHRPKAKFWQGAGVGELLSFHAEKIVSDTDLRQQKRLPNGWLLNSKEELMYYRIFHEHFGDLDTLDWMGRTKQPTCT